MSHTEVKMLQQKMCINVLLLDVAKEGTKEQPFHRDAICAAGTAKPSPLASQAAWRSSPLPRPPASRSPIF